MITKKMMASYSEALKLLTDKNRDPRGSVLTNYCKIDFHDNAGSDSILVIRKDGIHGVLCEVWAELDDYWQMLLQLLPSELPRWITANL